MQPIAAKASGTAMKLTMGEDFVHGLWTAVTRRIAFGFGLVIGIAILGALAFTLRTDVRVLWFDERGYPAIGMLRTETQERLEQALRELTRATHLLKAEKAQKVSQEQQFSLEIRRHQEAELATRQRLLEAEQTVSRARKNIEDQIKTRALFEQQNTELRRRLEERESTRLESKTLSQLQTAPKLNEYRAARLGDQLYLPLRELPQESSRTLKAIPANAAGLLSFCKLAVYQDAVFVEASYQGVTGWVSGYYLDTSR